MRELVTLPEGADAAAGLEVLERDGVVIFERLIAEQTIDAVARQIGPHLQEADPGGGIFYGRRAKRCYAVIGKAPSFADVLAHPTLLGLADGVLGPSCERYRVQLTVALETWPGGEPQLLHRDEAVYGRYLPYGPEEREYLLSFIVAGTDFTVRNGATRIVPGSHRWPLDRQAKDHQVAQAAMPRGSAAIWLGSVLHGMGVNATDAPRTGFASGYSLGWLRQEENQYLACPPDVARGLPERVQQLLGYETHDLALGFVEGRDSGLQTRPGDSEAAQVAAMDAALSASREH